MLVTGLTSTGYTVFHLESIPFVTVFEGSIEGAASVSGFMRDLAEFMGVVLGESQAVADLRQVIEFEGLIFTASNFTGFMDGQEYIIPGNFGFVVSESPHEILILDG